MKKRLVLSLCLLSGCGGLDPLTREAQDAVKRQLRDPDSAQFRDVERCSGDREVVRGEVNSRNGFGGYIGFQSFFYADYRTAFASDVDGSFMSLMNRCYRDQIQANSASGNAASGMSTNKQE
jgi:hypothetical protein